MTKKLYEMKSGDLTGFSISLNNIICISPVWERTVKIKEDCFNYEFSLTTESHDHPCNIIFETKEEAEVERNYIITAIEED